VSLWDVLDDAQRLAWSSGPLRRVGPLRFGMTTDDVRTALSGTLSLAASQERIPGGGGWAEYELRDPTAFGPAVTTYYDESDRLAGVAVSALCGPQVAVDGLRLVGRTPSRLEDEFRAYLASRDLTLRYSQFAHPWAPELGLVLRVQRAGDLVLSRPVFVAPSWAERCGDTSEGAIPIEEWRTFEW
jgi:hypothetical protein